MKQQVCNKLVQDRKQELKQAFMPLEKPSTQDTEAILLVDASNAFNRLNRATALRNMQHSCPKISKYLINTYRQPARLILGQGKEILSTEGTTQGDNLAMAFYALGIKPLTDHLRLAPCIQEWYADDASALGKLLAIKAWWDMLSTVGPRYGYFPKPEKCWLVVKNESLRLKAQELFPSINITTTGQRFLGATIGSDESKTHFVKEKIQRLYAEVEALTDAAKSEPHLAYSVFVKALQGKWTFLMRTLPNIETELEPLEARIHRFLEVMLNRVLNEHQRRVLSLPCAEGGIGIIIPTEKASQEYRHSRMLTENLKEAIKSRCDTYQINRQAKSRIKQENKAFNEEKRQAILESCSAETKRSLKLLEPKGTSSWLTTTPSRDFDFYLNRDEFRDAISLRYDWPILNMAKNCECGTTNNIDHALICKLGGFTIMRHNAIRDLEAELLSTVCKDVTIEPPLIETTAEKIEIRGNVEDSARLDVSCRSFWAPLQKSMFDVRVTHPNAPSYRNKPIEKILEEHENQKKSAYQERVQNIEHASFTPLVFATNGAMGEEATRYHAVLAEKLSIKTNCTYPEAISFIRKRLSFTILKTALIALHGKRKKIKHSPAPLHEIDINFSF